ncbi:MAG TPA: hypothetical protein VHY33_14650 [Thermoanaerobaculia bacterium]|jgi:hypothetical protein|nr:hypothetical protein [Thermoanaerobaculia bacterium]
MTAGGVDVVFVTVIVPSLFVTTRIGATTRAVPAARVDVDEAVVVDEVVDAAEVVVVGRVRRRLPRGGFAARVGLGFADEVRVGVRTVVLAPVAADIAAGVVLMAAVVGVAVVAASVGVVMTAAVVGVTVALFAAIVGATAVVPAVAAVVALRKTAEPVPESPAMTGIGSELIDAFTVASGFAYAEGGTSWPVGCAVSL